MINTYDIVRAFARGIHKSIAGGEFETDIYTNRRELQGFDNSTKSCFFVEKHSISSRIATLENNKVNTIVDIFYYPNIFTDRKVYQVSDMICSLFTRNIDINREILDIVGTEVDINKDNVGGYLHIAVTLDYFDLVHEEFDDYDFIESVGIATV